MSKQQIAAIEQQGCSTPIRLPKDPTSVNDNPALSQKVRCTPLAVSHNNIANISNHAFEAKYKALTVVAITDLITGDGFDNFTDLDDDRQEAILSMILQLTLDVQRGLEHIQAVVDAPAATGGEA